MRSHIYAILLTAALPLAGCGGDDSKKGDSGGGGAAAAGTVKIASFKFVPPRIEVKRGARVTFTNADTADHTATSDTGGAFDTGNVRRGKSVPVTLDQAGTFAYHCDFHPFMKGTVVVE